MVLKGIFKAERGLRGGFRKMHGTVDSIFTLKMLTDKYVKSKPQKHRNLGTLSKCFVDFRNAFECIRHRQKLLDQLRKEGVQGRFLNVLISVYSNDKSAVNIDNKLTQILLILCLSCRGKASLHVASILFNFYLSDLPRFLNTASSTDIMLSGYNCLLYATI